MAKTSTLLDIFRSQSTVLSFKEILLSSKKPNAKLLKRRLNYYVKKGDLYAIRRGLYTKDKNYDRKEVATKIFTPAYVSFETILFEQAIIFQFYSTIFVATYQTKDIECDGQRYSFKKLKDTLLIDTTGVEDMGNYFAATKERAYLDMLYLNNDYYLDNPSDLDFDKIFSILPIYKNKRIEKVVKKLFNALHEEEEYMLSVKDCDCKTNKYVLKDLHDETETVYLLKMKSES